MRLHSATGFYRPLPRPLACRLAGVHAADGLGSQYRGSVDHTFTAEHLLAFVRALARLGTPLVVVLDNASIHVSRRVHDEWPALEAAGSRLFYLPPYSPRLNPIEPFFGVIKHHEMPLRTYPTLGDLDQDVDVAFTRVENRLLQRGRPLLPQQLRPAA